MKYEALVLLTLGYAHSFLELYAYIAISFCVQYSSCCVVHSGLPIDLLVKQGRSFSDAQRRFAMTLHFYGSKAYKYLKRHIQLPSEGTIRR
jgi:hypothetical protein